MTVEKSNHDLVAKTRRRQPKILKWSSDHTINDAPIFRFYGQFHKGVLPKLVVVWFPNNEGYRAFRNNFDMVLHNTGT